MLAELVGRLTLEYIVIPSPRHRSWRTTKQQNRKSTKTFKHTLSGLQHALTTYISRLTTGTLSIPTRGILSLTHLSGKSIEKTTKKISTNNRENRSARSPQKRRPFTHCRSTFFALEPGLASGNHGEPSGFLGNLDCPLDLDDDTENLEDWPSNIDLTLSWCLGLSTFFTFACEVGKPTDLQSFRSALISCKSTTRKPCAFVLNTDILSGSQTQAAFDNMGAGVDLFNLCAGLPRVVERVLHL